MRESSRRGRAGLGRSSLTCSTEGKALPWLSTEGKCFLAKSAKVSSVNKESTPLSYKGPSGLKLPLVVRKLATLEKSKHLRALPLPGQEQGANARAHRCVWTPPRLRTGGWKSASRPRPCGEQRSPPQGMAADNTLEYQTMVSWAKTDL